MDIQVQIINAFVDNGVGGNPAGVVLDADELNAQQKLSIASIVGISETAFVSSSNSAAFKLEFGILHKAAKVVNTFFRRFPNSSFFAGSLVPKLQLGNHLSKL